MKLVFSASGRGSGAPHLPWVHLALQGLPVPVGVLGGGFVGGLQEVQEDSVGIRGCPNRLPAFKTNLRTGGNSRTKGSPRPGTASVSRMHRDSYGIRRSTL